MCADLVWQSQYQMADLELKQSLEVNEGLREQVDSLQKQLLETQTQAEDIYQSLRY